MSRSPFHLSSAGRLACLALCLFALCLATPCSRADTINFVEKPWDQLPNHDIGEQGQLALEVRPNAWLHGESPSWILHYRRITEAKRVALEIDFHMNFVARTLGAQPEQVAHKANVFIFEDDKDWKEFMARRGADRLSFAASFAIGENLFLNVRNGTTGMFNSQLLAHETTHAIVARIFHRYPPLWLSEGFAEEMSGRSTGARMGQYNQRLLQHARTPLLSVDQILAIQQYPTDLNAVFPTLRKRGAARALPDDEHPARTVPAAVRRAARRRRPSQRHPEILRRQVSDLRGVYPGLRPLAEMKTPGRIF